MIQHKRTRVKNTHRHTQKQLVVNLKNLKLLKKRVFFGKLNYNHFILKMSIIIKKYLPGISFSIMLNLYSQHITNKQIKKMNDKYEAQIKGFNQ